MVTLLRLHPLFASYLQLQLIEGSTEVGNIVKRLLGDGLSNRARLRTVPAKHDDARVMVLHG